MTSHQVVYGGWYLGLGLLGILAVVLIGKKAWKRFPMFTIYAIFTLLTSSGLYLLSGHPVTFAYTYWVCEVVGMLLGLGVVYEVFIKLFAPYNSLRRLASNIFYWALLVLVIIGGVVLYAHKAVEGNRFVAAFFAVEESVRIIEVGLILSLFLFASAFGLHWRQSVFGIALGLGLFSTVELLGITMRAHFGVATTPALNVARVLCFDASLLVWLGYLVVPERVTSQTGVPQSGQLEQWNQAVKEFIYQ
jgi:hypothetical protein